MKCTSVTKKGTQCKRDAIHPRVPHCWQHTKELLMESLRGLDEDEPLDNEQVYDIFIDALVEASECEKCEETDAGTMQSLREEVAVLRFELERINGFLEDCESDLVECEEYHSDGDDDILDTLPDFKPPFDDE